MIKEENGMWMFEFGSGDIEVGSGLALNRSNEFRHCVSFTNQDVGEIGAVSERFKNIDKTSDFHFNALFTFECVESIDVVIKHLEHCKKCMTEAEACKNEPKYNYDSVGDIRREDVLDDNYIIICKYQDGRKGRYSDVSLLSALNFVGEKRLIFKLHVWGTKRR